MISGLQRGPTIEDLLWKEDIQIQLVSLIKGAFFPEPQVKIISYDCLLYAKNSPKSIRVTKSRVQSLILEGIVEIFTSVSLDCQITCPQSVNLYKRASFEGIERGQTRDRPPLDKLNYASGRYQPHVHCF